MCSFRYHHVLISILLLDIHEHGNACTEIDDLICCAPPEGTIHSTGTLLKERNEGRAVESQAVEKIYLVRLRPNTWRRKIRPHSKAEPFVDNSAMYDRYNLTKLHEYALPFHSMPWLLQPPELDPP